MGHLSEGEKLGRLSHFGKIDQKRSTLLASESECQAPFDIREKRQVTKRAS